MPIGTREPEGTSLAPRSYVGEVLRRFATDPVGMGSLGLLVLIVGAAVAAPLLSAYDPLRGSIVERLRPPGSPGHWLGTDEQGRDLFARLLYGGRISLLTGMAPVVVATIAGTLIGTVAAYVGRGTGTVLMRIMDVSYAFPAIILSIAITASLGAGIVNSMIALTIVFIPPVSRIAESATRQVMAQAYIEAARLSGASTPTILAHQVLPNIAGPIVIYAAGLVGLSIMVASGLSFLGLGPAAPTPEWGQMLNNLRGAIYVQPFIAALPGFLIFLTSMVFNVLSDRLRDALDVSRT